MAVRIRTLSNTVRDRRTFINLPWDIYRDNPHWVPPLKIDVHAKLNPDKCAYHEHADTRLFVAERSGRVVGRIAAHVNYNHEEQWRDGAGFFGFFECIDDQEVASALFEAAADFLRERGRRSIRGPFSWTDDDEVGILMDAYDREAVIMMPYNPPYYPALLEGAGFEKAKDLYAYWIEDPGHIPERLRRGVELVKKRNRILIRHFNMKDFWNEVELVRSVYADAWRANWGAVRSTDAEFEQLAKDLRMIVDPRIVYLAFVDGELAGLSLSIPDANQAIKHANGRLLPLGIAKILWHKRKITHIRVLALGVLDKYRNHGIDTALYHETFDKGRAMGYRSAEMSWILEDNYAMRNPLEKFGAHVYKTYRVYEKPL